MLLSLPSHRRPTAVSAASVVPTAIPITVLSNVERRLLEEAKNTKYGQGISRLYGWNGYLRDPGAGYKDLKEAKDAKDNPYQLLATLDHFLAVYQRPSNDELDSQVVDIALRVGKQAYDILQEIPNEPTAVSFALERATRLLNEEFAKRKLPEQIEGAAKKTVVDTKDSKEGVSVNNKVANKNIKILFLEVLIKYYSSTTPVIDCSKEQADLQAEILAQQQRDRKRLLDEAIAQQKRMREQTQREMAAEYKIGLENKDLARLRRIANQGHHEAMAVIANIYYDNFDFVNALPAFQRAIHMYLQNGLHVEAKKLLDKLIRLAFYTDEKAYQEARTFQAQSFANTLLWGLEDALSDPLTLLQAGHVETMNKRFEECRRQTPQATNTTLFWAFKVIASNSLLHQTACTAAENYFVEQLQTQAQSSSAVEGQIDHQELANYLQLILQKVSLAREHGFYDLDVILLCKELLPDSRYDRIRELLVEMMNAEKINSAEKLAQAQLLATKLKTPVSPSAQNLSSAAKANTIDDKKDEAMQMWDYLSGDAYNWKTDWIEKVDYHLSNFDRYYKDPGSVTSLINNLKNAVDHSWATGRRNDRECVVAFYALKGLTLCQFPSGSSLLSSVPITMAEIDDVSPNYFNAMCALYGWGMKRDIPLALDRFAQVTEPGFRELAQMKRFIEMRKLQRREGFDPQAVEMALLLGRQAFAKDAYTATAVDIWIGRQSTIILRTQFAKLVSDPSWIAPHYIKEIGFASHEFYRFAFEIQQKSATKIFYPEYVDDLYHNSGKKHADAEAAAKRGCVAALLEFANQYGEGGESESWEINKAIDIYLLAIEQLRQNKNYPEAENQFKKLDALTAMDVDQYKAKEISALRAAILAEQKMESAKLTNNNATQNLWDAKQDGLEISKTLLKCFNAIVTGAAKAFLERQYLVAQAENYLLDERPVTVLIDSREIKISNRDFARYLLESLRAGVIQNNSVIAALLQKIAATEKLPSTIDAKTETPVATSAASVVMLTPSSLPDYKLDLFPAAKLKNSEPVIVVRDIKGIETSFTAITSAFKQETTHANVIAYIEKLLQLGVEFSQAKHNPQYNYRGWLEASIVQEIENIILSKQDDFAAEFAKAAIYILHTRYSLSAATASVERRRVYVSSIHYNNVIHSSKNELDELAYGLYQLNRLIAQDKNIAKSMRELHATKQTTKHPLFVKLFYFIKFRAHVKPRDGYDEQAVSLCLEVGRAACQNNILTAEFIWVVAKSTELLRQQIAFIQPSQKDEKDVKADKASQAVVIAHDPRILFLEAALALQKARGEDTTAQYVNDLWQCSVLYKEILNPIKSLEYAIEVANYGRYEAMREVAHANYRDVIIRENFSNENLQRAINVFRWAISAHLEDNRFAVNSKEVQDMLAALKRLLLVTDEEKHQSDIRRFIRKVTATPPDLTMDTPVVHFAGVKRSPVSAAVDVKQVDAKQIDTKFTADLLHINNIDLIQAIDLLAARIRSFAEVKTVLFSEIAYDRSSAGARAVKTWIGTYLDKYENALRALHGLDQAADIPSALEGFNKIRADEKLDGHSQFVQLRNFLAKRKLQPQMGYDREAVRLAFALGKIKFPQRDHFFPERDLYVIWVKGRVLRILKEQLIIIKRLKPGITAPEEILPEIDPPVVDFDTTFRDLTIELQQLLGEFANSYLDDVYNRGENHELHGEQQRAFADFKEAASQGCAKSLLKVANIYRDGNAAQDPDAKLCVETLLKLIDVHLASKDRVNAEALLKERLIPYAEDNYLKQQFQTEFDARAKSLSNDEKVVDAKSAANQPVIKPIVVDEKSSGYELSKALYQSFKMAASGDTKDMPAGRAYLERRAQDYELDDQLVSQESVTLNNRVLARYLLNRLDKIFMAKRRGVTDLDAVLLMRADQLIGHGLPNDGFANENEIHKILTKIMVEVGVNVAKSPLVNAVKGMSAVTLTAASAPLPTESLRIILAPPAATATTSSGVQPAVDHVVNSTAASTPAHVHK